MVEWTWVFGLGAVAMFGIILYQLTGNPRMQKSAYQPDSIKAVPSAGSWHGLRNAGQIESISRVSDGKLAVKTFGADYDEIVEEDDIMITDMAAAMAGIPDHIWFNKKLMRDEVSRRMMMQLDQAKTLVEAQALQIHELNRKMVALSKDSRQQLLEDAKLVGAVRKEGSSGFGGMPFSPYGGGGLYRRPYISPTLQTPPQSSEGE